MTTPEFGLDRWLTAAGPWTRDLPTAVTYARPAERELLLVQNELVQNEIVRDLSPLASSRRLRDLRLTHCPRIQDLSPLAGTAVDRLALHLVPADLATLAGIRLHALAIRDRRLAAGLDPLPADLPLTELTIDNPARNAEPRGHHPAGVAKDLECTQVTPATGEAISRKMSPFRTMKSPTF
jgi:hypothetical protein